MKATTTPTRANLFSKSYPALCLGVSMLALSMATTNAMDTDIFMAQNSPGAAPNVLIVLDNTSNWSRQNQHWPGGIQQGQSEVNAIKTVIQNLPGSINIGLMELPAKGNANDNGGYIRFAVSPMGQQQGDTANTNRINFTAQLTTIYNDINGTTEKQNSNMAYGNLMYDAYNYFASGQPFALSADVLETGHADSNGYITNYTRFRSPLSADTNCANNYIIFIGNPNASGPASDETANTRALNTLAAATQPPSTGASPQLDLQLYTETTLTVADDLGTSADCYSSAGQCASSYACPTQYTSCSCPSTATSTASQPACTGGKSRYQVFGNYTRLVNEPTKTFVKDSAPMNADEWARFLYKTGVPVPPEENTSRQTISTYTIDVYNAQPNAKHSSLLASMARSGGGKYFSASNEAAIVTALQSIFSEIQAINTTFASASLPISATNRSQNANQVYIGMFRPDPTSHPRWFGNLKRYQLGVFSGYTDLAYTPIDPVTNKAAVDPVTGKEVVKQAINPTTGFITPCATSWWTTDSESYWYDSIGKQNRIFITDATSPGTAWQTAADDTAFATGLCPPPPGGIYSDLPDGPTVEKGGAAQVLRQQSSRSIKTLSGTSLIDFNTSNITTLSESSTVNANIVNFVRGQDITGEISGIGSTAKRPSIHGDVVHSRPLPVDYGSTNGVYVYYGANDGAYHAVNATTGQEAWSFVAPESYGDLQRLLDNKPLIQTPSPTPPGGTAIAGATPKSFFFDGSTGLYQNLNNSQVWIYPVMRRGGRMIYAFDVTDPTTPLFKWKAGCPAASTDTGCTTGFSGIGQTWSTPNVAMITGYSTTTPVIVVGGGHDTCDDADTSTPSCSTPKGAKVFVINGNTGALIQSFDTDRSVVADVALVDINQDGSVDAAYVADTGGNLYRIDFSNPSDSFTARTSDLWTIRKVAYTNSASRKFLFAPTVLPYRNTVYIAIGSGDREHPLAASYPYTTPVTNRFYVYLDDPLRTTTTNLDGTSMFNRTDATLVGCNTVGVFPGGSQSGWYMDLSANGRGEQVVTSALIIGGMVTFSTNRPIVSTNACTNILGEARGYWVNLLNGSGAIGSSTTCGGERSSAFVGGGLPPSPVAGTVSIDGGKQVVVIGAIQRDPNTASSPLSGQQIRPPVTPKRTRIYWRTPQDNR